MFVQALLLAGLPRWPAFTPTNQTALLIGDEIRAGIVPNEPDLRAIDRLYRLVRFALDYWRAIAAVLGLAVVLLLWRAVRFLLRRRAVHG